MGQTESDYDEEGIEGNYEFIKNVIHPILDEFKLVSRDDEDKTYGLKVDCDVDYDYF